MGILPLDTESEVTSICLREQEQQETNNLAGGLLGELDRFPASG